MNQSIPIGYFMIRNNLTYFRTDDYTEEIRSIMAKMRYRDYPVLDSEGRLVGMMTRHSLLEMDKKKVILVDHNESGQAVDGLHEAEIEEIFEGKTTNIEEFFKDLKEKVNEYYKA